ncbi:MAG: hypothetical protein ABI594_10630 [Ginsengibacter sp.]
MKKILVDSDPNVLRELSSIPTLYVPKEKYIPSQRKIKALEKAYEKKMELQ